MANTDSNTNVNAPATGAPVNPEGEGKKPEQLGLFNSLGYIAKGAYMAPVTVAIVGATVAQEFVQHKDDFAEKTAQAMDLFFNGAETILDGMEAAQELAREAMYGVKDAEELKKMTRQQRVALIKAKAQTAEE